MKNEKYRLMEHPEFMEIPLMLRNHPAFDFGVYLKNKHKSTKQVVDELNQGFANFDNWLNGEVLKEAKKNENI